jgi:uncharacterized protein YbjQ (UPF0145 family)
MRGLIALLVGAMALGCAGQDRHAKTGGEAAEHDDEDEKIPDDPATIARAANVQVLENSTLGCPAEALGPVDVHKKMETTPQALEGLKRRAAALGADAIINVEFEHGEGGKEPTHLSGLAVRCNDLLKGRKYDVIGEVEVKGAMGKEERAFQDLMAKARTLHADMLINIKYDHGEGGEGEGSKMTATAVKFR